MPPVCGARRLAVALVVLSLVLPASGQSLDELRAAWSAASGSDRPVAAARLVNFLAHSNPEEGVSIATADLDEARALGFPKGEARVVAG